MDLLRQEIVRIHRLPEEPIDLLRQEESVLLQEGKEYHLQEVEMYQLMEEVKQVPDRMILIEETTIGEIEEDKEIVGNGEEMMILVEKGIMIVKIEFKFYC